MTEIPSRQSAGGVARAAKLSPEERKAIASKAAQARWSKDRAPGSGKPRWADLEAEGWRRVSVKLSPSAAARLDALIAAHGYDADEAIRRLLNMGEPPVAPKPALAGIVVAAVSAPVRSREKIPKPRPIVRRLKGEWTPP